MRTPHSSPTREKVLEIIKREKNVTVKELTKELEITPMAIRGHLNKLEKDSLITVETLRQKLGRPLQVFSLTNKGESFFPKMYSHFAIELLDDIKNLDDGKTLKKVIRARENRQIKQRQNYLRGEESADSKLKHYCDFIEKNGQMPTLKKNSDNSYSIKINNCPLLEIAHQNPFCCESETRVISEVFPEANVIRTKNQLLEQDNCCCYKVDFK